MKRLLCALGLCVVCACVGVAADPPSDPAAPAQSQSGEPSITGRKQIEALLHSPAKLDFGGRKTVKVGEVLDSLFETHHISLRFDTPTLTSMLSQQATGGLAGMPGCTAHSCYLPIKLGLFNAQQPSYSVPPAAAYMTGTYSVPSDGIPEYRANVSPVSVAYEPQFAPAASKPAAAPAVPAPVAPAAAAPIAAGRPAAAPAVAPAVAAPSPKAAPALSPAAFAPAAASPAPALPQPLEPARIAVPDQPKAVDARSPESESTPTEQAKSPKERTFQELLGELLKTEIDLQHLNLERVSIATILHHALETAPTTPADDFSGAPILLTNAMVLDYLIEEDGLLITTRMKALTAKETRIYSIKHLSDIAPEQLAKTIRHSVRPWSWRSQINDLGDQLKGTPLPGEAIANIVKAGAVMVGSEVGISVNPTPSSDGNDSDAKKSSTDEVKQLEMVGNAVVNGVVTLAQATISALEMVHHGEPPTGTIQLLGNKLVVTQSQTAHREIAELLKLLADE